MQLSCMPITSLFNLFIEGTRSMMWLIIVHKILVLWPKLKFSYTGSKGASVKKVWRPVGEQGGWDL